MFRHREACEEPEQHGAGGRDGVPFGRFSLHYQGLELSLTCRQGDFADNLSEEGKRTKNVRDKLTNRCRHLQDASKMKHIARVRLHARRLAARPTPESPPATEERWSCAASGCKSRNRTTSGEVSCWRSLARRLPRTAGYCAPRRNPRPSPPRSSSPCVAAGRSKC